MNLLKEAYEKSGNKTLTGEQGLKGFMARL